MERVEYEIMAQVEQHHWWYRGMRAGARALLADTQLPPKARLLDVGCGTGGTLAHLFPPYGQAFGIDIAPEAVTHAWNAAPGRVAQGSALELPYVDGAFDLVSAFEVLYHRAVPDEVIALTEMRRVLRPGGYALIRMPAYNWLRSAHDAAVHTRRRYVAAEVEALLRASGFTPVRLTYTNMFLFPIAVATRLAERLRPTQSPHVSAMAPPSPPLNWLLRQIFASEARLIARGWRLPMGLSVFALGRNDKAASSQKDS